MNILKEEEALLYSIGLIKRYNENFLSDLVWANCRSDKSFKQDFFHSCFNFNYYIYYTEREVSDIEKGRNDFHVYTEDGLYILENKINDTNLDRLDNYLELVKNDTKRLFYIVPKNWGGNTQLLKNKGVNVIIWEELINKMVNKYKLFSIIASTILNINQNNNVIPQKPSLESVKPLIRICDEFYDLYFLKDDYKEKKDDYNRNSWKNNEYSYGYSCWASVWFGFTFCPTKGLFFCFTYGKGGMKEIKEYSQFKYINPLGKYFNDEYNYYEIKESIENIDLFLLENAFKEFASLINVKECTGKYTPLIEFIHFGKID